MTNDGDIDFAQRLTEWNGAPDFQALTTRIREELGLTKEKLLTKAPGQWSLRFEPNAILRIDAELRAHLKAIDPSGCTPHELRVLRFTYEPLTWPTTTFESAESNVLVDESHPMLGYFDRFLEAARRLLSPEDTTGRNRIELLRGDDTYARGTRLVVLYIMLQLGITTEDLTR